MSETSNPWREYALHIEWCSVCRDCDGLNGPCFDAVVLKSVAVASRDPAPLPESECIHLLKFGKDSVAMVRAIEAAHGIK